MTEYIVVAVSPFYSGMGWEDNGTGVVFTPTKKIEKVRVAKNRNLSGIKNAIRLNHLMLLEGELDTAGEVDTSVLSPGLLNKEQLDDLLASAGDGAVAAEALRVAKEEITSLKAKETTLTGKVSDLEDEKTTLNGKVSKLEGEKTTLTGKVSKLEGEKTTLDEEIVTLKARVEELESTAASAVHSMPEDTYMDSELGGKTAKELKATLDEKNISYVESDKKADLISKLVGTEK